MELHVNDSGLAATIEIAVPPLIIVDYEFTEELRESARSAGVDPDDFEIHDSAIGYVYRVMIPVAMAGDGAKPAITDGSTAYAVVGAGATEKGLKGALKTVTKTLRRDLGKDTAARAEHRLNGDAAAMKRALASLGGHSGLGEDGFEGNEEPSSQPLQGVQSNDRESELRIELERLTAISSEFEVKIQSAATLKKQAKIAEKFLRHLDLVDAVSDELDALIAARSD
ncbi:hypothetical protein [Agromyces laixinhei]|uniref:hypothetical protein n=1 Tax=Agromyces laixinhei TaxID=2585717 RepID=UPI00111757DA|nr:hypothetical protein [Agromyces laixinhei]